MVKGSLLVRPTVFFLLLSFGLSGLAATPTLAQNLPVPVYEIKGNVFDSEKFPLADATVSLSKADGTKVKDVTTDANGAYSFTQQAAGKYIVSAVHKCCLRATVDVAAENASLTVTAPDLILGKKTPVESGRAVLIKGVTRDQASGKGVPGVTLEIQSSWDMAAECPPDSACAQVMGTQYFSIQTDGAGAYEIEVNYGDLWVSAYKEGFDRTYGSASARENRTLDVPMRASDRSTVRLFGTVQDLNGSPLGGAYVNAGPDYDEGCYDVCPVESSKPMPPSGEGGWTFESSSQQWNSTQAGKDGTWEMQIAPGRLRITAYADQHLEGVQRVDASSGKETRADFRLERIPDDTVVVRGQVVDAATGDPIPFADVNVENQKWGSWASAQTDADGRYELRVKPGYSVITFSAYKQYMAPCSDGSGGGSNDSSIREGEPSPGRPMPACEMKERDHDYFPRVQSFEAKDGAEESFDAKLSRRAAPTSTFQGYVLNASSNQGIEGASVTFFNEATRDWGQATTDKDGSYKILVHAGYYSIRVYAPHYFDGVVNAEVEDDEVFRLDAKLTPGEKRYGYWMRGGYAVADAEASSGPDKAGGAPPPSAPEAPPEPSEGNKAYVGAEGGLGPYKPAPQGAADAGGAAPGLAPLLAFAVLAAFGLRRRK